VFELITQTFNASMVAVTQLFLSTVITTNPWFEGLDIQYLGLRHEIVCNTRLQDSFTETLDEVLLSGQNITLHFRFDLHVPGDPKPLQSKEIVNGFRFDSEANVYYLVNSEEQKLEKFFTIGAAKDTYITVRNLVVVNTENLDPDQEYFLRVTAFLDPIKLENKSESVNLMMRWASVKPTIASEKFKIQVGAT